MTNTSGNRSKCMADAFALVEQRRRYPGQLGDLLATQVRARGRLTEIDEVGFAIHRAIAYGNKYLVR